MEQSAEPYELIGGDAGVHALAKAFYEAMDRLPQAATIRAMHGADLGPIQERLYEYLSGWLGGPRLHYERHGHLCIRSAHAPYAIGPAERDQWLMCMSAALDAVQAPEAVRALLRVPLYRFADGLRNDATTAAA